ncbi:hypothetical protein ACFLX5_04905 [Chloroflexota bacterium]
MGDGGAVKADCPVCEGEGMVRAPCSDAGFMLVCWRCGGQGKVAVGEGPE